MWLLILKGLSSLGQVFLLLGEAWRRGQEQAEGARREKLARLEEEVKRRKELEVIRRDLPPNLDKLRSKWTRPRSLFLG